jgi:hypothetical protein
VFDLALGYAISRDDRYAEAFWSAVESFIDGNPPFRGIQWSCGQETSIRALSCLWGERIFASSAASTAARRARIQDLFAWSGERVSNAIEYAISQRNNHGISEATGLIALGDRLAGRHPDAHTWLRDGARWIEYLVMDQFADDGWYIQHSLNYLRLALDQLVVAERVLLRARGSGLSSQARARVRAAVALLLELHDAEQGDVPNHGANDGSMVLPVTTRPYRDFRPSITAATATFGVSVPEHFGVSRNALAWLGLDTLTTHADPPARRVVTGSSGWVSARNGVVRVFARAGTYESNPSHIDPCHLDVWIEDQARALDAGTYRYTAPPPWRNGLALIGVHNTVEIPSIPAAVKGRRFLWLGRPAARVSRADVTNDVVTFELYNRTWAEHGVTHLRRCVLSDDAVDVFDEVDVGEDRSLDVRVHWLLPKGTDPPAITSDGDGRLFIKHADADSVDGWWSPHYGQRLPAVSIAFVTRVTGRRIVHSRFLAANLPNEPVEFSQERERSA